MSYSQKPSRGESTDISTVCRRFPERASEFWGQEFWGHLYKIIRYPAFPGDCDSLLMLLCSVFYYRAIFFIDFPSDPILTGRGCQCEAKTVLSIPLHKYTSVFMRRQPFWSAADFFCIRGMN